MFPTHILKNCLNFFAQDKDHSYLSFVFDLYTKSLKQTDTVLTEILSNYLVEAFSKKSVPFNVIANSKDILEFFQTYQNYSLTPSESVNLQKNKLKNQIEELGFFNQDTIIQLDSIFSQVMIDSFFEFSKISTKTFLINTNEDIIINKIHTEYVKYFNDQDIVQNFLDKPNGFYLVKKSIPDPFIVSYFCHSIVLKTNSKINIFDIQFEKELFNTFSGKRQYKFNDFIYKNFNSLKEHSSESNAVSINNFENSILKIKDYNLLVAINLIFIIQNQYDSLLSNSVIIHNYSTIEEKSQLPVLAQALPIQDITLNDIKFDSELKYLNLIEDFFTEQLNENIKFINFKPEDFKYRNIYCFKPFNILSSKKLTYTHFNILQHDYETAVSYGYKPDFLPLQQLGSISQEEYSKYITLFGQFNKISLLKEYFSFHHDHYYDQFNEFMQKIISEHWQFFFENRHLLNEEKTIQAKLTPYQEIYSTKFIVSDQVDFLTNKKIKAANKNVYANHFTIYSPTIDFMRLIENNFDIPSEIQLIFYAFYHQQQLKELGIKPEMKENFDIHNMNILSLTYFHAFPFKVLIPWKS